jgi:hypothetical protein
MAIAPQRNFLAFIVDLLSLLFVEGRSMPFGVPRRDGRQKIDTFIFGYTGSFRIPWTHITSIKKAPKGISESLGAFPIGIFWKSHFINPPEA